MDETLNELELNLTEEKEWHRKKRRNRRKATVFKKKRQLHTATYAGYPGPFCREEETFVRNPGRGRASKFLKKSSNRKVRHTNDLLQNGQYKKQYDYWWNLT